MTNQTPIKVECENCGYGRPWPGRYAEELEATKADLLAALEAIEEEITCEYDLEHREGDCGSCDAVRMARVAIRRARGED
jgi:succinate dehydrogenase/fumarate reductase-like Fe-S protein